MRDYDFEKTRGSSDKEVNMKKYIINMLFLFFLVASSSLALGMMIGLSTEELTISSDLIVIGSIQGVESMWSEDGKIIISRAKIIVDSVIRGRSDKRILTVEYLGGEVGDIGLQVSDVKPLKQGENLLLFLEIGKRQRLSSMPLPNEDTYYSIVGNAQGRYTITPQGIAKKDGFSVVKGSESIDSEIPLEALVDKIRRVK